VVRHPLGLGPPPAPGLPPSIVPGPSPREPAPMLINVVRNSARCQLRPAVFILSLPSGVVYVELQYGAICRISPPRFLDECRKKRLDHAGLVLLCFALFAFSWVVLSFCSVYF